jgi:spoIIIJ-associated protein
MKSSARRSVCSGSWERTRPAARAVTFLNGLCELAGLQCSATLDQEREESLLLRLAGQDVPLLVDRDGELLDALQHISNKQISRAGARRTKVILDAQGFRDTRVEYLKETALRSAKQVMATGRPVTLEPMNAHDRRIIHLELMEHGQVSTRSLGDGPRKKVVISIREVPGGSTGKGDHG